MNDIGQTYEVFVVLSEAGVGLDLLCWSVVPGHLQSGVTLVGPPVIIPIKHRPVKFYYQSSWDPAKQDILHFIFNCFIKLTFSHLEIIQK